MKDQNDQSEQQEAANAKRVKDAHHEALLRVADDVQTVLAFMRENPPKNAGQVLPMEVLSLFSTFANMCNTVMLSSLAEAVREAGAMASFGGMLGGGGIDGLLSGVLGKLRDRREAKRDADEGEG